MDSKFELKFSKILKKWKKHSIPLFILLPFFFGMNENMQSINNLVFALLLIISVPGIFFYIIGKKSKLINTIILAFSVILCLSFIINGAELNILKSIFIIYFYSFSLVVTIYVSDDNMVDILKRIAKYIMVLGFLLTAYSLITYFFGSIDRINSKYYYSIPFNSKPIFTQLAYGAPKTFRFTSIYENPNTFGAVSMLASMFSMLYIIDNFELKALKIFKFTVFLSFNFLGIVLSKSRASLLTILLFIFIIVLLKFIPKIKIFFSKMKPWKVALIITLTVILSVLLGTIAVSSFGRGTSSNNRFTIWSATINQFTNNWLLGVGSGNIYDFLKSNFEVNNPHNAFLQILVENGIIFFTLYFTIWFVAIAVSVKTITKFSSRKSQKTRDNFLNAHYFILAFMVSILFYQFFESKLLRFGPINFISIFILYFSVTAINKGTRSIVILSNHHSYTYKFRKEIISKFIDEGYKVSVILPYGSYVEKLEDLGCEFYDIPLNNKGTNPISDFSYLLNVHSLLKVISPNVILSYTIKPNIYGGISSKLLKIPFLPNITGLGTGFSVNKKKTIVNRIIETLYKIGLKDVENVLFQNQENLDFFTNNIDSNVKSILIPGSGVNISDFSELDYPDSEEKISFVFISRIMKEKGIDLYLEAAKILNDKYGNLEFHICGYCEEDYTSKLQKMHEENLIVYHGLVADVREIIKNVHCTVHPTYYPEGMSNALLESAASMRPLISTNMSGVREIIQEGYNGHLFEAKNLEQLVKKISLFIESTHEEKLNMAKNSRKKIEREFNRDIVVSTYYSRVESLLLKEKNYDW